jgi:hypothetical protein
MSKIQSFCFYYHIGLPQATTGMATEAAQPVTVPLRMTDLGKQETDERKPSPISTDAQSRLKVMFLIFDVYLFLYCWLLKYGIFYTFTSISCYVMIFLYDMNRRGCCSLCTIQEKENLVKKVSRKMYTLVKFPW